MINTYSPRSRLGSAPIQLPLHSVNRYGFLQSFGELACEHDFALTPEYRHQVGGRIRDTMRRFVKHQGVGQGQQRLQGRVALAAFGGQKP